MKKERKGLRILKKILKGVADLFPMGTTVFSILEDVAMKKLDRNNNGKIEMEDFKPLEIVGIFGGLTVLSILVSKGVIEMQILIDIVRLFGL